jgi:hypothetical protein
MAAYPTLSLPVMREAGKKFPAAHSYDEKEWRKFWMEIAFAMRSRAY